MQSTVATQKAEQPEEMRLQSLRSFIYLLSPSAPVDSGLNQFFGDDAYHISQLQGKKPVHSAHFLTLTAVKGSFYTETISLRNIHASNTQNDNEVSVII